MSTIKHVIHFVFNLKLELLLEYFVLLMRVLSTVNITSIVVVGMLNFYNRIIFIVYRNVMGVE